MPLTVPSPTSLPQTLGFGAVPDLVLNSSLQTSFHFDGSLAPACSLVSMTFMFLPLFWP